MAKAGLLFVGTDDGIVLFSDPGGLGRWLRIGHELRGQAVLAIWPIADTPLEVLAVADSGLYRSKDGGQSWKLGLRTPISVLAGHPAEASTLYLGAADGEVYISRSAGQDWRQYQRADQPAQPVAAIVAPADTPNTALFARRDGSIWVGNSDPAEQAGLRPFAAQLDGDTAALIPDYAQAGALYAISGGALFHYASGGAWQQIDAPQPPFVQLAPLAGQQPVLLARNAEGAILRSADGRSWEPGAFEAEWAGGATTLTNVRYHIDTAFAGSASGQVAQSTDRGRSWKIVKRDLPAIRSIAASRLI